MKVLVFNGSPRKNGNTPKLVSRFSGIASERGHTLYSLDNMTSCVHCSKCVSGSPCPLKDNFNSQGIPVDDLDAIVIASPLHFFSLTPKALGFLTRFYAHPLSGKVFGLILVSGSDFEGSGTDIVINQFKAIDNYCGTATVSPFHKVTYDKIWEVSDLDTEGLHQLLNRIEYAVGEMEVYNEA